jgi:hypothetical protein
MNHAEVGSFVASVNRVTTCDVPGVTNPSAVSSWIELIQTLSQLAARTGSACQDKVVVKIVQSSFKAYETTINKNNRSFYYHDLY